MSMFSDVNIFSVVFLSTVLITRVLVYVYPKKSPTILGFRTHHYMYGLAICLLAYFTKTVWLLAIGLGLFVDELTYLLIGGKTHNDNYSKISLLGTVIFTVILFLFSSKVVNLLR